MTEVLGKPIVPVILCGGGGTRLWPRSRLAMPKPFLPLVGDSTLFEEALARCPRSEGFAGPVVVTGKALLPHVESQLGGREDAAIIVEPAAKNTAPAIALAALRLPEDATMLVCPSDHHIADHAAFAATAHAAAELAADGWLVSFGITPTAPETGFGYLKRGEPLGERGFRVERFVEKPELQLAKSYLADGGYAWNGGIFAFRAGVFLAELMRYRPDIFEATRAAVEAGTEEGRHFYPSPDLFGAIEGESIDYAVMEKTSHAALVPAAMGWSDIGNWQALHASRATDDRGNAVSGRAELVDCDNVLVDSDGPRVSVIGLSDVIIVVDGDEVLVTSAQGAQKVGKLSGATNQ